MSQPGGREDTPQAQAGEMAGRILDGDRRALARAITLVESTLPEHRARALALAAALGRAGRGREALRIALSGTPGVGKSTFIDAFGMMLVGQGLRVAVLAIDPSSARSGGSILGDKTRMDRLAREPRAFIRPSPSRAQMGGVARRTRETVALCEAAGFDVVLIETVGVGQSETMAALMSDLFVLLMAPAGGDELQGMKRGIMEMADMILVNKADGDLAAAARRTVSDYRAALRLLRPRPEDPPGFPCVLPVSALGGKGLEGAWERMNALAGWRRERGHWSARRAGQATHWFAEEVRAGLLSVLEREPVRGMMGRLGERVAGGAITPEAAAQEVLAALGGAGAGLAPSGDRGA